MNNLRTFEDVVRELSEKYNIPYEIVEGILIDWTKILYLDMCSVSTEDLNSFGE